MEIVFPHFFLFILYMAKQITNHVQWVGKIDWQLRQFHGNEFSTHRGSSYNSYLVSGSEKTILIDTVWQPFDKEFVARLEETIDLSKIDAIVMNHNEVDHSGALPELLRKIPDTPVYCTKKGEAILRGMYHQEWNFVNVKTGDKLSLGDSSLTFIEATMLHWPDTMFSYFDGDGGILFSNDGFGQHFATESLYDDLQDLSELLYEAEKYYVNILNPYNMMAARKVKEILAMNLPLSLICPSHGVIWRNNISKIIECYQLWSSNYQRNQVTILYDTMWNSTRTMAEQIAAGIREVDQNVCVKLFNVANTDKNDILTEVARAKCVLVGSPTVNNGYTYAVAGILEMIRGLKFKNKKAAAFGSYGWGGEAVKMINAELQEAGFEILNEGLRCQWVPNQEAIEQARQFGKEIAKAINM